MSTEVASGHVKIDLDDRGLATGLARAKGEFDATMAAISAEKAKASVDADIKPLRRSLKEAELLLKNYERKSAQISKELKNNDYSGVVLKNKQLEQRQNANLLGQQRKLVEGERQRLNTLVTQSEALGSQIKQHRLVAKEVRATNDMHRAGTTELAKQELAVANLRKGYRDLQRDLAKLDRVRVFDKDTKLNVDIDRRFILAKMEMIRTELQAMGDKPIEQKINFDRNLLQRLPGALGNLGNLTVRLGPFTASIKQLLVLMPLLGSVITDIGGTLTAFIGVLGTGLAGAAAIGGAGLLGFGQAALGVFGALRPAIQDFKSLQTVQKAYDTAVLKHGRNSKEAAEAQKQLNEAMKGVDPVTKQAVQGISQVSQRFHNATQDVARRNFGTVVAEGVKTANALLPAFEHNTNRTLNILGTSLTGFARGLRSEEGQGILGTVFGNFNKFLGPALSGLGSLATVFGRVAQSASRFLGPLGRGFQNWAKGLENAIQPGRDLDNAINRLAKHAQDVGRFFMALGRIIGTVFNGSADAGDRLINTMTDALNRWNDFLRTPQGKESMDKFFQRAVTGAQALYSAIEPLIASFVKWSSVLSPVSAGIFKAVAAVSNILLKLTELLSLAGPLGALGVTLGAIWAVGKIGAFVAMLSRAVALLREAAAVGGLVGKGGLLRTLAGGSGSIFKRAAPAAVGAAEGAGAAAVATRTATATRGLAAAEGAAAAGAAGLSLATVGAVAGVAALGVGIYLLTRKSHDFEKQTKLMNQEIKTYTGTVKSLPGIHTSAAQSYLDLASSQKQTADAQKTYNKLLKDGKLNTEAGKQATLDLKQAKLQEYNIQQQTQKANEQEIKTARTLEAQRAQIQKTAQARLKAIGKDTVNFGSLAPAGSLSKRGSLADLYKQVATQAAAAGTSVAAFARASGLPQDTVNKLVQYGGVLGDVRTAAQQVKRAIELTTLSFYNQKRAAQGLIPIADKFAGYFAKLQQGNLQARQAASRISTNFIDPAEAGRVAKAASNAISSGVSGSKVFKIVANTHDADAAIARLNARTIEAKTVKVKGQITDALRALGVITGKRVPQKVAKVIGNIADALRKHGEVASLSNILKYLRMMGQDAGARALYNTLSHLGDIHKNIVWTGVMRGTINPNKPFGVTPRGPSAMGSSSGPSQQATNNASQRAAVVGPQAANFGRIVNKPTFLVGEERGRNEFVISDNPAYRDRNRSILMQAISAIGVPAFAKGKGGKNKAGKYKAHRYKFDGDALDITGLHKDLIHYRELYQDRQKSIKKDNDKISDLRGKKKPSKGDGEKLRKLVSERDRLKKGVPGKLSPESKLEADFKRFDARYKLAAKRKRELEELTTNLTNIEKHMETSSSQGNSAAFEDWKGRKRTTLADIAAKLKELKALKGSGLSGQSATRLDTYLTDIEGQQAVLPSEAMTAPDAPPTLDLETIIDRLGRRPELNALQNAYALSELTPDLTDDRAAAAGLTTFFSSLFGQLTSATSPYASNLPLITEAAGALRDAKATQESLAPTKADTPDQSPDQAAQIAQLTDQLAASTRSSASSAAYLSAALGPGDIGSGSFSGWESAGGRLTSSPRGGMIGGGSTVIINTLHPGDPATLRAIGDAATGGMSLQGSTTSPRQFTGL